MRCSTNMKGLFFYLISVLLLRGGNGGYVEQPTNQCDIEIVSATKPESTSTVTVNGLILSSRSLFGIDDTMKSQVPVTEDMRVVGALIGANCMPLNYEHQFYLPKGDNIRDAFDQAPRGTILVISINTLRVGWKLVIKDIDESFFARYLGLDLIYRRELTSAISSMGEDLDGDGFLFDDVGFEYSFDSARPETSLSFVVKKGFPELTQSRLILSHTHAIEHHFIVPMGKTCRSPLPPPSLVGPPVHSEIENLLDLHLAYYDRLLCGGVITGWEYVPNAAGHAYFGLWNVVTGYNEMTHATLQGYNKVMISGEDEHVHYHCVAHDDRIEANFGDVYGVHYGSTVERHIFHPTHGRTSPIQMLDCDEHANTCKQIEPFSCGRSIYNGDVDPMVIIDVNHNTLTANKGYVFFDTQNHIVSRTLAFRPILDPDFVYTCFCISNEDCQGGGDTNMVCSQDEGRCKCRQHYTYMSNTHRCAKDLAVGKYAWQQSTLGNYHAMLAVDNDTSSYGESCSYTDPYYTFLTDYNIPGKRDLRKMTSRQNVTRIRKLKEKLAKLDKQPLSPAKTVDGLKPETSEDSDIETMETVEGLYPLTLEDDVDPETIENEVEPKNVNPDAKKLEPEITAKGNGLDSDNPIFYDPRFPSYLANNYMDYKVYRAPWFVIDLGYEAYIHSIVITPPAVRDDYLTIHSEDGEVDIHGREEFINIGAPPYHFEFYSHSYWLLFDDNEFQGERLFIGPETAPQLHENDDDHHLVDPLFDDHHVHLHDHADDSHHIGYQHGHLHDDHHREDHHHDNLHHHDGDVESHAHSHHASIDFSINSALNVAEDVFCVQHKTSGLYFAIDNNNALVLSESCELFYIMRNSQNLIHVRTGRTVEFVPSGPSYYLQLGGYEEESYSTFFLPNDRIIPFNIKVNPFSCCLMANGMNSGERVSCETYSGRGHDCSSFTRFFPLRHYTRYARVMDMEFETDGSGTERVDVVYDKDVDRTNTENTHCISAKAVSIDENHYPNVQVNYLSSQQPFEDSIDFYTESGNTEVVTTIVQTETLDNILDYFKVVVTNDVDEENAPMFEQSNLCLYYNGILHPGIPNHLQCDTVIKGRYVAIIEDDITSMFDYHYMSLCNLQVYATAVHRYNSDCSSTEECTADGDEHLYCHHGMCKCVQGYYYPHYESDLCDDIDECLSSPCEQTCVNTPGSYHCECRNGMILSPDHHTCIDENECLVANSMCEHFCFNYPDGNGYFCTCKPGYELESDEHSCTDINECALLDNDCRTDPSAQCVNTDGSYMCKCPYEDLGILWDGSKCTVPNADSFCDVKNGLCEQECVPTGSLFFSIQCRCSSGFILAQNQRSCLGDGLCESANGGCNHICRTDEDAIVCSCYRGYTLLADGKTCIDSNECDTDNGACHDKCINTPGSHECLCFGSFVPFNGGERCIAGSKSVVFELKLSGLWVEALRDMWSPESKILAESITLQLNLLAKHFAGEKHTKLDVVEFLNIDSFICVRVGAIYSYDLTLKQKIEVINRLKLQLQDLTFTTPNKQTYATIGRPMYIDVSEKGLFTAHKLTKVCDVYDVLEACLNDGKCIDNTGDAYCECMPGYTGWQCEDEVVGLSHLEIGVIAGGAAIVVVIILAIIVCACLWDRINHKQPLEVKDDLGPVDPYYDPYGHSVIYTERDLPRPAPRSLIYEKEPRAYYVD